MRDFAPEPELTEEDLARYEEIERQQELENEAYGVEMLLRMRAARMQRTAALVKAQAVKRARYEAKCEVAAGRMTVPEAIYDDRVQGVELWKLFMWPRGWGGAKAHTLCHRLRLSPARQVGELTDRQRQLIVDALTEGETP